MGARDMTRNGEAGLGLLLAKLLVEAAGGSIALTSGKQGGMRVVLTFPRTATGLPATLAAG